VANDDLKCGKCTSLKKTFWTKKISINLPKSLKTVLGILKCGKKEVLHGTGGYPCYKDVF
jgi:hypothetical protein